MIVPYQVITGNYNAQSLMMVAVLIVPYQVITGNYNSTMLIA